MRTFQRLLARLGNLAARPRRLATLFTQLHAALLNLSLGRLRRSLFLAGGQPVLVLTTRGRRPAWWLNLQADPHAEILVDGRRLAVRARPVHGSEADRLQGLFDRQIAGAEVTRGLTTREIPVIVLEPADPPFQG